MEKRSIESFFVSASFWFTPSLPGYFPKFNDFHWKFSKFWNVISPSIFIVGESVIPFRNSQILFFLKHTLFWGSISNRKMSRTANARKVQKPRFWTYIYVMAANVLKRNQWSRMEAKTNSEDVEATSNLLYDQKMVDWFTHPQKVPVRFAHGRHFFWIRTEKQPLFHNLMHRNIIFSLVYNGQFDLILFQIHVFSCILKHFLE